MALSRTPDPLLPEDRLINLGYCGCRGRIKYKVFYEIKDGGYINHHLVVVCSYCGTIFLYFGLFHPITFSDVDDGVINLKKKVGSILHRKFN